MPCNIGLCFYVVSVNYWYTCTLTHISKLIELQSMYNAFFTLRILQSLKGGPVTPWPSIPIMATSLQILLSSVCKLANIVLSSSASILLCVLVSTVSISIVSGVSHGIVLWVVYVLYCKQKKQKVDCCGEVPRYMYLFIVLVTITLFIFQVTNDTSFWRLENNTIKQHLELVWGCFSNQVL